LLLAVLAKFTLLKSRKPLVPSSQTTSTDWLHNMTTSPGVKELVEVKLEDDVTLKQLTIADASGILELAISNKEYLSRFKEYDESEFASIESTGDVITSRLGRGILDFGILRTDQLVGRAVLTPSIQQIDRMAGIAYWVGEEHTGRGYATKAAGAMIEYAFKEWDSLAVNALVLSHNQASKRVLQHIGLKPANAYDGKQKLEFWSIDHPLIRNNKDINRYIPGFGVQ
jgi:ribosomal-protein-alanine N-acetyltransferase